MTFKIEFMRDRLDPCDRCGKRTLEPIVTIRQNGPEGKHIIMVHQSCLFTGLPQAEARYRKAEG
jgi:hypothetical protein